MQPRRKISTTIPIESPSWCLRTQWSLREAKARGSLSLRVAQLAVLVAARGIALRYCGRHERSPRDRRRVHPVPHRVADGGARHRGRPLAPAPPEGPGADAVCHLLALFRSELGQWDAYWATNAA